jgi:hypothetical protein
MNRTLRANKYSGNQRFTIVADHTMLEHCIAEQLLEVFPFAPSESGIEDCLHLKKYIRTLGHKERETKFGHPCSAR